MMYELHRPSRFIIYSHSHINLNQITAYAYNQKTNDDDHCRNKKNDQTHFRAIHYVVDFWGFLWKNGKENNHDDYHEFL